MGVFILHGARSCETPNVLQEQLYPPPTYTVVFQGKVILSELCTEGTSVCVTTKEYVV